VAELDAFGLRRSLDDVEETREGELAEDGREQGTEALIADARLLDGVARRGAPEVFPKAELGCGDRRSVVHQRLPTRP
jgi:hypothetical protein